MKYHLVKYGHTKVFKHKILKNLLNFQVVSIKRLYNSNTILYTKYIQHLYIDRYTLFILNQFAKIELACHRDMKVSVHFFIRKSTPNKTTTKTYMRLNLL